MPYYLVEEHTCDSNGGSQYIPFHITVHARTARRAFATADEQSKATRTRSVPTMAGLHIQPKEEPCAFMFAASELREVVPHYLWVAADGSTIWYEVRLIDSTARDVTSRNVVPLDLTLAPHGRSRMHADEPKEVRENESTRCRIVWPATVAISCKGKWRESLSPLRGENYGS